MIDAESGATDTGTTVATPAVRGTPDGVAGRAPLRLDWRVTSTTATQQVAYEIQSAPTRDSWTAPHPAARCAAALDRVRGPAARRLPDVTDLLAEGENVLAGLLGDGWYRGRLGWDPREDRCRDGGPGDARGDRDRRGRDEPVPPAPDPHGRPELTGRCGLHRAAPPGEFIVRGTAILLSDYDR